VIGSEAGRGVSPEPRKRAGGSPAEGGRDARLLSMPSRFSTIGFPLQDQSGFSDLVTHLAAEAQRIPVSGGAYLLWASPGGEPGGLASRSYIPSGTFTPEGGATEPPQAFGIFTGHVLEAATKRNRRTGAPFSWALVDTLLGTFDVVIDPELLPHPPRAGHILKGSFWFSGTFTTTAPANRGLLGRLAHKLR
jgi:hypothetical protein